MNIVGHILMHFWYLRCRFTAKRRGIIHYHFTLGSETNPNNPSEVWLALREFHRFLCSDRSLHMAVSEGDWKELEAKAEAVRNEYKIKYKLTDEEVANLHRSCSPYRIPEGLSYSEVRHLIAQQLA